MNKYIFLMAVLVMHAPFAFTQSPLLPKNHQGAIIFDRWDILYPAEKPVFTAFGDVGRKQLTERAIQLSGGEIKYFNRDREDLTYVLMDNGEYLDAQSNNPDTTEKTKKVYDSTGVFYSLEPIENENNQDSTYYPWSGLWAKPGIFGLFYKNPADFFQIKTNNFSFHISPLLFLSYGDDPHQNDIIFRNTRGMEARGLIDQKIYFYTNIIENQARFMDFIERKISKFQAIPGQGAYKDYHSGIIENLQGYDFANSTAYAGINVTKSLAIELGHGRHFIGHGIRSLFLSDYSQNYFYLKFNTRVWKFRYQNLFTELAPLSAGQNPSDHLLPKKYMVNHTLSFLPFKNVELSIFESVVFARQNHFEFQYLNPIILYRVVESFLDSPDNALVGAQAKWNIARRFQLYGQFLLDEFKVSEIIHHTGWWGNKNGIQLGVKYINVLGVDHLDAQLEYNRVRPYTYTHRDTLDGFPRQSNASYSHFNQPLAHPLGANFKEVIFHLRYQPTKRWTANLRYLHAIYGQDTDQKNYGGNILLQSNLRVQDYGNVIGQGLKTTLVAFRLDLSYCFAHNFYLNFTILKRKEMTDMSNLMTSYIGGSLRANFWREPIDY